MKKLVAVFVFTLFAGIVIAADEKDNADSSAVVTEEPANQQQPGAEVELAPVPNQDEATEYVETEVDQGESAARFIPSERISEDLGISFPVDI